ncbi:RNA-directed DNA polymerase, eukaryota, Reverse transcriptase zinc-binding domain protein [Artemisia annua]|uniref:RNA-directed DNA polymerase, eukaryota, Reverse transcriptase zinc-binding domain protein n=1 Tax=Artemisia annua TaxID=35608 RepID=A0A2U1KTT8_ARTAN|nr:RNA-directed DNA polymerase, eukaryota, Reverse transcriptase zinc-binding domain protein [Artemisia annua]
MGEWSEDNIKSVARVLRVFNICSGLKINIHKSHLFGIGVNMGEVEGMAGILGCQVGALPFEYLGIRVGANMNLISNWTPVVETIKNRLSSWKANTLSMGGRMTLIKSVLSSLPIYYLSLYKAPCNVVDQIEGLMNNFLWAGSSEAKKVHWVSWEVVTTTKNDGGLGVLGWYIPIPLVLHSMLVFLA